MKMTDKKLVYITHSQEQTFDLGVQLAPTFQAGDVVLLEGQLGVGKSVFIRGVASAKGVTEAMPSPTFTIVNRYETPDITINHFDLYRINDAFELYEIGFEEYIYDEKSVTFIEWPSKGQDLIPETAVMVDITINADNSRTIRITRNNK